MYEQNHGGGRDMVKAKTAVKEELKDEQITKWEVTTFDVLDEFQFKYDDLVGASSEVEYGKCIERVFEFNDRRNYNALINMPLRSNNGGQQKKGALIQRLMDRSPILYKWLIKQAGYFFCGIDYPYDNMYGDFFFDQIKEKVIKGEHCAGCKHKIQCELRGGDDD
jgi:hypothetical protein